MDIKYDTPIEVSESQYKRLMTKCAGLIAGRQDGERFFIKVWFMEHVAYVKLVAGF